MAVTDLQWLPEVEVERGGKVGAVRPISGGRPMSSVPPGSTLAGPGPPAECCFFATIAADGKVRPPAGFPPAARVMTCTKHGTCALALLGDQAVTQPIGTSVRRGLPHVGDGLAVGDRDRAVCTQYNTMPYGVPGRLMLWLV